MTESDVCPRCSFGSEDIDHLFRRCAKSKELWGHILKSRLWREKEDRPMPEWILLHSISKNVVVCGEPLPWSILFCATIWQIWKDRNRKSFDNLDPVISVSTKAIVSYTTEIVQAFQSPVTNGCTRPMLISWAPPCAGTTKLNTDGCWNQTNGSAGFEGIFRDTKGDWILGYYGKLNCESSLEVEIWGIYRGLTIILEKSLTNIKIESDSIIAVESINGGNSVNHPQRAMINDAHAIMVRTGTTLNHTYREANQCADHLARIGAEQNEDLWSRWINHSRSESL